MVEIQPSSPVSHIGIDRAVAGALKFARDQDIQRPTLDEMDLSFYEALGPEVDDFIVRPAFREPFRATPNQVVVGSFSDLAYAMHMVGNKMRDPLPEKQINASVQRVVQRGHVMNLLGVTGLRAGITVSDVTKVGYECEPFIEGSGITSPIQKLGLAVIEVYPAIAKEISLKRIKLMRYKGMSEIARKADLLNQTAGKTVMPVPLAFARRRKVYHR